VPQAEVPQGRNGKHHGTIEKIMSALEQLEVGRALKIELAKLPDSKENVRSALNRETRMRGVRVSTASDEDFLYVWKSSVVGNGKIAK
jgi:TusA-related sulfurtransferase